MAGCWLLTVSQRVSTSQWLLYHCSFRLGRQEDAHEYLVALLDAMHESYISMCRPKPSPELSQTSMIYRIFAGRIRSQVQPCCRPPVPHPCAAGSSADLTLAIAAHCLALCLLMLPCVDLLCQNFPANPSGLLHSAAVAAPCLHYAWYPPVMTSTAKHTTVTILMDLMSNSKPGMNVGSNSTGRDEHVQMG